MVPCAETPGSASANLQIIHRKQINAGEEGEEKRAYLATQDKVAKNNIPKGTGMNTTGICTPAIPEGSPAPPQLLWPKCSPAQRIRRGKSLRDGQQWGGERCRAVVQGAMLPPTAEDGGPPKHPACPAGRQLLPDPLAGSRRAAGCCRETPALLPPQLILACIQLIMEPEGDGSTTASPALAGAPACPLSAPCSLLGGLEERGLGCTPTPGF